MLTLNKENIYLSIIVLACISTSITSFSIIYHIHNEQFNEKTKTILEAQKQKEEVDKCYHPKQILFRLLFAFLAGAIVAEPYFIKLGSI